MEVPPSCPLEDIRNAIIENGFFAAKDPVLGQNIKQMDDDEVHFASAGGLQFCKINLLDNPVSRHYHSHQTGP